MSACVRAIVIVADIVSSRISGALLFSTYLIIAIAAWFQNEQSSTDSSSVA